MFPNVKYLVLISSEIHKLMSVLITQTILLGFQVAAICLGQVHMKSFKKKEYTKAIQIYKNIYGTPNLKVVVIFGLFYF